MIYTSAAELQISLSAAISCLEDLPFDLWMENYGGNENAWVEAKHWFFNSNYRSAKLFVSVIQMQNLKNMSA